jgi:hypothetical protein
MKHRPVPRFAFDKGRACFAMAARAAARLARDIAPAKFERTSGAACAAQRRRVWSRRHSSFLPSPEGIL